MSCPLDGEAYAAHPALLRMWDKRRRGYRAMGYRIAEPSALERV
ncbi:MAG: hypothetical protein O3C28_18750 [Proteobacteria bacterium]|nr:hypothetical protein [Pseudomonadota bacterium]